MPLYIKDAKLSDTEPEVSMSDAGGLDDFNDFLQDPDKLRDILPQPYRLIDILLNEILENAWVIYSTREAERVAELARIRPPKFQTTKLIQELGSATCLCASRDGACVAVGQPGGLLLLNTLTHASMDLWAQEEMTVRHLHLACLSEDTYLISTVDDTGLVRLFGLAGGRIYFLQAINESQKPPTFVATKCEISFDGNYLGICYDNAPNRGHVEIYKCPRDAWIRELDALVAKMTKLQAMSSSSQLHTPQGARSPISVDAGNVGDVEGASNMQTAKFSLTSLLFKIRSPVPLQPSLANPSQLPKDCGDVIAQGNSHHLLSAQHLESRETCFTSTYHDLLPYLPKDKEQADREAHFHFVTAGRMLAHGVDNPLLTGTPNTVFIWWTGWHQVLHYSLIKLSKDPDPRPDLVWPMAHGVVASAVSPCTSLLAFALTNGSVTIWDKHLGTVRRVVHLTSTAEIQQVAFLSPDSHEKGDFRLHTKVFLLATCRDSQLYLTECQFGAQAAPTRVTPPIDNKDERYVDVKPMPGIPHLVIACREDGSIYIIDLFESQVIGEITLPDEFTIVSPLNAAIAVGGQEHNIYINAAQKSSKAEASDSDSELQSAGAFCVLPMNHYSALNKSRMKQQPEVSCTNHTVVQTRVDTFFAKRLCEQQARKDRMQTRWAQMKGELKLMLSDRQEAASRM